MAKNRFGTVEEAPEEVTLEDATKLSFPPDLGEDIDFEEIDEEEELIENLRGKLESEIEFEVNKNPDGEDGPGDEDIDEVEAEEIKDEEHGDFTMGDFIDAEIVVEILDGFRQAGYPKVFDKVHSKKKIIAYKKHLGRLQSRTDEQQTIYLELEKWEEKFNQSKDKFEDKLPWSEKYKAQLVKYLDFQFSKVLKSKRVPVIVLIAAIEAYTLFKIFMSKTGLPELDFEIPDIEELTNDEKEK